MERKEFTIDSTDGNPRNSEGSFLALQNGNIIFVFSRYCGGSWEDNDTSDLAYCISADDGTTWSRPEIMIEHSPEEGNNLMSVSLLRLQNGRILLVYIAKKDFPEDDFYHYPSFIIKCRFSDDECKSWSKPKALSSCRYNMIVNNDRLVQLSNGRIIVPAACAMLRKTKQGSDFKPQFSLLICSDDNGESWYELPDIICPPPNSRTGNQEPGVIELSDGKLLMWMRTDMLCQYYSYSNDDGMTWSSAQPWKTFPCALSPLSIKRDPADSKLVAIWNDSDPHWGVKSEYEESWNRTPLIMAISRDNGKTWGEKTLLESDPHRGYCYTAIFFTEKAMLLAYCYGGYGHAPLQDMKIVRIARK